MKTLKIMGIIGIVISALSFVVILACDNAYDYEGGLGWGLIASLYLLAFAIVGIVKSHKN